MGVDHDGWRPLEFSLRWYGYRVDRESVFKTCEHAVPQEPLHVNIGRDVVWADQTVIVRLTRHAWEIGHERVTQEAEACGLGVCQREW
jgi:hypothetical protein